MYKLRDSQGTMKAELNADFASMLTLNAKGYWSEYNGTSYTTRAYVFQESVIQDIKTGNGETVYKIWVNEFDFLVDYDNRRDI